jgi:hypothetical protein
MIRVLIQLLPAGDDSRVRELGRITIVNVNRHGREDRADYEWSSCGRTPTGSLRGHYGKVENHPRDAGALALLRAVLGQIPDEREPER